MSARHWLRNAFGIVLTALPLSALAVLYLTNRSPRPARSVLNPSGRLVATLAYQPGLGSFPESVARALGDGLVSQGWQVRLVSATSAAMPDVASADLLILLSPIYWAAPARPMRRFVRSLGDLGDRPVIVVLTGAGSEKSAPAMLSREVERVNGRVLRALVYYTMKPNDEAHYKASRNRADALRLAREAAVEIVRGWQ